MLQDSNYDTLFWKENRHSQTLGVKTKTTKIFFHFWTHCDHHLYFNDLTSIFTKLQDCRRHSNFSFTIYESPKSEVLWRFPSWLVCLNLVFFAIYNSFEGGAGLCAIVGANKAGSLSFRETFLVTTSTSSFRMRKTFAIKTGMYSYFFLTFTTTEFHSLVRWLYFLVSTRSPPFVVAASWVKWKFQSTAANCFLALYAL